MNKFKKRQTKKQNLNDREQTDEYQKRAGRIVELGDGA